MPSIYDLKPAFQGLLRPVCRWLAAAGVTANQVTLAALLLSLLSGAAITLWPQSAWPLLALAPVLFVRMALNAIDGMLAREHGMQSPLGAFLNEVGDVVSDAALYLPFALLPGVAPAAVVVLVLLAALSEMTGICAMQVGASRRYDGPMGKSDRAFLFGALGLLLGFGLTPGAWTTALLGLASVLAVLTCINRVRFALREINQP